MNVGATVGQVVLYTLCQDTSDIGGRVAVGVAAAFPCRGRAASAGGNCQGLEARGTQDVHFA